MIQHLNELAEIALLFLFRQSVSAAPLFIFSFLFSIISHYKFPKVQQLLWSLFLLRLALPLDLIFTGLLYVKNTTLTVALPSLNIMPFDNFNFMNSEPVHRVQEFNMQLLILICWIFGTGFFLMRFYLAKRNIKQIQNHSMPAGQYLISDLLKQWQKRLQLKQTIQIRFTDLSNSAFNTGYLNPVIILPYNYRNLSAEKLNIIIGHECVHIKRFDNLMLFFQTMLQSFFFFTPLSWIAGNYLNISREQICDSAVIHEGKISHKLYGIVLMNSFHQPGIAAATTGFNINHLILKVRLLTLNRSKKMNKPLLILFLFSALFLFAFSAGTSPISKSDKQEKTQNILFSTPIKTGRISSGFGMRTHPIYKVQRMHNGIDIAASKGTPLYASADGLVSFAAKKGGYGNMVVIDHADGFQTFYGQLSKIKVKQEEQVKRGQLIGLVGMSGLSTAPHLHYELHKNGKPIDPASYIDFSF